MSWQPCALRCSETFHTYMMGILTTNETIYRTIAMGNRSSSVLTMVIG